MPLSESLRPTHSAKLCQYAVLSPCQFVNFIPTLYVADGHHRTAAAASTVASPAVLLLLLYYCCCCCRCCTACGPLADSCTAPGTLADNAAGFALSPPNQQAVVNKVLLTVWNTFRSFGSSLRVSGESKVRV